MSWHVCPGCGFSKHFEPGDGSVCNVCVERGHTQPQPITPYDFDVSPPSRKSPQLCDGGDALTTVERDAWLEFERAYTDFLDVEFRHMDGQ